MTSNDFRKYRAAWQEFANGGPAPKRPTAADQQLSYNRALLDFSEFLVYGGDAARGENYGAYYGRVQNQTGNIIYGHGVKHAILDDNGEAKSDGKLGGGKKFAGMVFNPDQYNVMRSEEPQYFDALAIGQAIHRVVGKLEKGEMPTAADRHTDPKQVAHDFNSRTSLGAVIREHDYASSYLQTGTKTIARLQGNQRDQLVEVAEPVINKAAAERAVAVNAAIANAAAASDGAMLEDVQQTNGKVPEKAKKITVEPKKAAAKAAVQTVAEDSSKPMAATTVAVTPAAVDGKDSYTLKPGDTLYAVALGTPELMKAMREALGNNGSEHDVALALSLIMARKNGIEVFEYAKEGMTLALPSAEDIRFGGAALQAGIFKDGAISWTKEIKGTAVGALLPKLPDGQSAEAAGLGATSPTEVQVRPNDNKGAINASVYKDGRLLATENPANAVKPADAAAAPTAPAQPVVDATKASPTAQIDEDAPIATNRFAHLKTEMASQAQTLTQAAKGAGDTTVVPALAKDKPALRF